MPAYIIKGGNFYVTSHDEQNVCISSDKTQAYKFYDRETAKRHIRFLEQVLPTLELEIVAVTSSTPITWNNILSQSNLKTLGWDLAKFAGVAKELGYNYIDWSGCIYDVELDCQTGIYTSNVPANPPVTTETFNIKKSQIYTAQSGDFETAAFCAWNNDYRLMVFDQKMYVVFSLDCEPKTICLGPLRDLEG